MNYSVAEIASILKGEAAGGHLNEAVIRDILIDSRKLIQPEASLSSQARQQAVRRAAWLLDEGQQQRGRGQKRAPGRTHARRCSTKRSRQFGRWDVWIERAQSAASSMLVSLMIARGQASITP